MPVGALGQLAGVVWKKESPAREIPQAGLLAVENS
jgi:hypothetical protein